MAEGIVEGMLLDLYGFYYDKSKRQIKLDGSVEIMPNGVFTGDIYDYAYGLKNPQQKIKGHIVKEGDIAKFVFLKNPLEGDLTSILFNLQSPITELEPFSYRRDNFKGSWSELPYKIEYNEDFNLFMAKIDILTMNVIGKTELSLVA